LAFVCCLENSKPITEAAIPNAQDMQWMTYTIDNDSAVVTGYTGHAKVLTIPDTLSGHPVTAIGDGAFSGCAKLESFTFPKNLAVIGENAFSNCPSIASVLYPGNAEAAVKQAFSEYPVLQITMTPLEAFSYEENNGNAMITCYSNVKRHTYLTMPNTLDGYPVTGIDDEVFINLETIEAVSLPANLHSIGQRAFSGCTCLQAAELPAGVTHIGSGAFANCYSLRSARIPVSVLTMGYEVFSGCRALSAPEYYGTPAGADTFADDHVWTAASLEIYLRTELSSFVPSQPERYVCLLVMEDQSEAATHDDIVNIADAGDELMQEYAQYIKSSLRNVDGSILSFTFNPDAASVLILAKIDYYFISQGLYTLNDYSSNMDCFNCAVTITAQDVRTHEEIATVKEVSKIKFNTNRGWTVHGDNVVAARPYLETDALETFVKTVQTHTRTAAY
jgi:hypothetical protein